jgi:glycosyltransferase involved in cell wall biosynthesis
MSEARLASIIVSSYNYGRFLKEAIDSALNQTYSNIEVIVVDDGSSDNSVEVIASYGNRITSLLKKNGGQASALNAGYALSRGEVVLFLDSDDSLLPKAVERVLRVFDAPEVVKVHWKLLVIDEQGRRTGEIRPKCLLPEGDLREDRIRNGIQYYGDWPATSGNAWSRQVLERLLPIPEAAYRTCPDVYLSVLAPVFGPVRRLAEPQTCYRVHGRNHWDDVTLADFVRILDRSFVYLRAHLEAMGYEAPVDVWKRKSWFHQVYQAKQELASVIPWGEYFVLVDQDELTADLAPGPFRIPFLEREGEYWGPPLDDEIAVREFERLRQTGARFMVFAWPAFWWLDYYTGLHHHVRTKFPCVLESDRLVVFDLRHSAGSGQRLAITAPADPADGPISPGTPEEEATSGAEHYLATLARVHETLQPELYLEIGVRDGNSLRLARRAAIGVDPKMCLTGQEPRTLLLYHKTSDEFFERDAEKAIGRPVDLAFIDGLHLFEYALRDFMNLERRASRCGLIVVHDIFPNHPAQGSRFRRTQNWAGDVWRLLLCLVEQRPDLVLLLLDSAPTGLLFIAGLDPANRTLWDNYNPITRRYLSEFRAAPPPALMSRTGALDPGDPLVRNLLEGLHRLRKEGADAAVVRSFRDRFRNRYRTCLTHWNALCQNQRS